MMHRLCSALVAFLTASLLSGCLFTSEEGSTPQDNSAMTVMDMESDGSDMSDMPAPPEDDGVSDQDMPTSPEGDMSDMPDDMSCSDSTDCERNDICVEEMCVPPQCGGPDTPGCTDQEVCDGRACVAPECATGDGTCGDGEICLGGLCRPPECDPDTAPAANSCAPNEGCDAGRCVDLLTDDANCGGVGLMCPPSTACRAGMCVCEGQPLSGNYRSLATGTSNQGIQHFPEPKIAAFIDEHRFVCEVPRTAGGDCPEGSLRRGELDPAYPSEAPHYVVAYPDTSDNIQLLLLSERGDVLEVGTISAPTLQAPGGQLIDIRLEQSADGLLLFAWWRGGFGTTQYEEFVQAYNIITPADGGVEGQSLPRQGQGSLLPRQPISLDPSTLTGLMLDFSFAQTEPFMGPGGRILQLTSMPYFVSEVNDDGDQPTLEIKTRIAMYVTVDGNDPFKLPINTNNVGLTGVTAATDFAHELYIDSQGRIVLTLTSYEPLPTANEPDSTVAPRNRTHEGLTYTRKSFSVQLTLNDLMAPATLIEFDARDLTEGKVPTPSEDSTVFEDRSNLPAPINITRRGSSDFTALGWTFWSKTVGGGPEEFFSRLIVNDISSATSAITSALELPKRFIFDQAFPRRPVTTSPDSPRLVIWAETGIHPMSKKPVRDISSVRFTTARLKGPNAPEIPGPKALSSPGAFGTTFPVQTVDAQAGTRSVGVIAHGQNTKNTITPSDDVISLYFYVIVGDRPVCQFRGTPSTGP